ncbi:MAG: phosphate ABC transporter permease PstA [Methanomicrobiales archaeon]|nr:phosphate ABC transporter permease PstA [Methanomicrobiales archaeon]
MRRIEEAVFKALMVISLFIVLGSLLAVILVVVIRGAPALTLSMVTQVPQGGFYLGKEGGILNAIIGSLYVATGATLIAIVIALPFAWYLNQYAGKSRFADIFRAILDIATGVPSLLYGAFAFSIMLAIGAKTSLLWGILTIALFITPLLARSFDEVIQTVPFKLKEASFALGATRLETVLYVVSRQALPGILTGILLAFGRGIGDAASILFTAGYTDSIPTSLGDPVATLPLAIFFQLGSPIPAVQARAYASGIILLAIVLILSVVSRVLTKRYMKYVIK